MTKNNPPAAALVVSENPSFAFRARLARAMGNAFCAPVLPHEDENAFWMICEAVCAPYVGDPIALLLAWDVAVLSWKIARVRRAETAWIWQEQVSFLEAALARAMVNRDACP